MSEDTHRRRSLSALLEPRSVAVIGASDDPARIGGKPLWFFERAGYAGNVYAVNPNRETVQGHRCYAHISEVPEAVDVAVVAVPARHVVATVADCAARGVRSAAIFSAGFAETGPEGRRAQDELTAIAAHSGLRLLGPNCLGLYNSAHAFYATFTSTLELGFPAPRGVAIISQSGAYGSHVSLLAYRRGIGIHYWVTTGNECDVELAEVIAWMAENDDVRVIGAYAEGIRDRDALIEALSLARANGKPIVFMKVGRSAVGSEAAASHTASLAGADAVYDAALRQFGAYRARDTEEFLDVIYACAHGVRPRRPRLGLLTVSGGVGIQMADAAAEAGLEVPPMPQIAQRKLKELLPIATTRNPVDTTAQ
ncbi:MAG: CoA-binding protein, partial [Gammaproteobacteria bacterium]|nr:CoA-binding protein [Gammaproteobacteria bacterium]